MPTRITHSLVTAISLVLFSACTVLPLYFAAFTCKSPDGKAEIRVLRNFPGSDAEYRFRVEVRTNRGATMIYKDDRGSDLRLIEAHWSHDGSRVGILVCNWGRPLLLGYDIPSSRLIDSSVFRRAIEAQLQQKYRLSGTKDVFYWACTSGGLVYPPRDVK